MSRLAARALIAIVAASTLATASDFVYTHENVLGTSFDLYVTADDEAAAEWAEARVLGEVDRLAKIFSGYDGSSEFRRWEATANVAVKVSPELFELLRASDDWTSRSGGAFDPRVEALSRLWSRCARAGRPPTIAEQAEARALMSRPAWRLDPALGTAERLTNCPISLNSIAKGEIIGRATAAALDPARGVRGLVLNIGGDIRVAGGIPRRIGVASPRGDSETTPPIARVEVNDHSVATSGDYQRGFSIQGRWYSHIFDPRTGFPAATIASATVIADRASVANALATTFCVLPTAESLRLAKASGVECLLVASDGAITRSEGFARHETTAPLALAPMQAPNAGPPPRGPSDRPGWAADFELEVTLTVAGPAEQMKRYRRPYLAIWVEDKEGRSVRTLALWLQSRPPGPRWHPELKRWYRADQARKLADATDLIATTSRATRPAGKYAVVWDGKDDRGQPVAVGEYTLFIEAAREHGTYQIIRQPVKLAATPFAEELKGNVEIKSAAVAYRRKEPRK